MQLSAGALPGIFVPKLAAQTVTLKRVRAVILSGTSIVAQCRLNGTNIGSPITITPVGPTFTFSQVLADADYVDFVLSAPTGNPADLSLTAFLEASGGMSITSGGTLGSVQNKSGRYYAQFARHGGGPCGRMYCSFLSL